MNYPTLTEDENFVLGHWSMWGSLGYPIVRRGSRWWVDGMRGIGSFPTPFKTKRAATERWEQFIGILRDRSAGRLAPSFTNAEATP